jgi:hypothetical protein
MANRFVLLFLAGASVVLAGNSQPPQERPSSSAAPLVVRAEQYDRSPALRTLKAVPPAPKQEPDEREPRPWRRAGRGHPLVSDPVAQTTPVPQLIPQPSTSFEGIGNVNSVLPPDTNGDVGPNHYVQWVNLSFAVYSKGTGTTPPTLLYGPAAGNTLWTGFGGPCEGRNDGDPIVLYDHLADRWVMSQLAVPNSFFGIVFGPFYQCVAVSATSDPLGAYNRYQFRFDKLNDYPKLGLAGDAYYMSINQYTPFALQFAGQGVVAFDCQSMLAGLPASMIYFDLASVDMNLGGMLPMDLDGPPPPPGAPEIFAQVDDDAWGYAPDQLQLWRFHSDWTNPAASSFTGPTILPTAPFDSNLCDFARNCIPQPGTTVKVDALADRLMYRLQYRHFASHDSLLVNHTVDADGTDHAGIRWYEIRDPLNTPVLYQQGTYAPDADHRWMGSAAMDGSGNIALGFSVSGPATSPSIRYTGRLAGDAPGIMTQGEANLMVGSGAQTNPSGRWGDYSMLAVDPSDNCTFWYAQEYYASTSDAGWQTRVGAFQFPSCAGSPPPPPPGPGVTVAAAVATASEQGLTAGAFKITRTGDTSAPLIVQYAVSGNATAGADYVALPGSVTMGPGESEAIVEVTPIDDPLVEPNETVVLTLTADASYSVGFPGAATVTIVSDDAPSDLIVSALTAPSKGGAGAALVISDTTKNQGSGSSLGSITSFYLSTNTVFDSSDVLLGSRNVPALAGGASDSGATSALIPAGTIAGTYFIVARADAGGANAESQEGNNAKTSGAIAIGPDLVVTALSVPLTASAGGPIAVTDTTTKPGGRRRRGLGHVVLSVVERHDRHERCAPRPTSGRSARTGRNQFRSDVVDHPTDNGRGAVLRPRQRRRRQGGWRDAGNEQRAAERRDQNRRRPDRFIGERVGVRRSRRIDCGQ